MSISRLREWAWFIASGSMGSIDSKLSILSALYSWSSLENLYNLALLLWGLHHRLERYLWFGSSSREGIQGLRKPSEADSAELYSSIVGGSPRSPSC
eukprot:485574-Amorphochlora_amoeboformis.AAC.1